MHGKFQASQSCIVRSYLKKRNSKRLGLDREEERHLKTFLCSIFIYIFNFKNILLSRAGNVSQ